jgi:hypothetical protein
MFQIAYICNELLFSHFEKMWPPSSLKFIAKCTSSSNMNTFPEELHSHGWAVRRLLLFIRSASPYWKESVHIFFQTKLEFSLSALEVEVSL